MSCETMGERLEALRRRARVHFKEIADAWGLKGPSSVQRYFSREYNPKSAKASLVDDVARLFVGKGSPAITMAEVHAAMNWCSTDWSEAMSPTDDTAQAKMMYARLNDMKPEGLSFNEWTAKAGVNTSFFTGLRNGSVPSALNLHRILKVIGVKLDDFFDMIEANAGSEGRALEIEAEFRADEEGREKAWRGGGTETLIFLRWAIARGLLS